MFHRILSFTSLALALIAPLHAQGLAGQVEGDSYVSPTGVFKVTIPVLPEFGGTITDTPNVVTFEDDFLVHASIAAFRMDATQRWENEMKGRRDYLIWFFSNFVQADFEQRFQGARIESARFLAGVQDGALLTFNLLPGGTMFADRIGFIATEEPLVAKRGNLLFVRHDHIFVLSIELAERAFERLTSGNTTEQEDELLRKRLMDLLARITFIAPK